MNQNTVEKETLNHEVSEKSKGFLSSLWKRTKETITSLKQPVIVGILFGVGMSSLILGVSNPILPLAVRAVAGLVFVYGFTEYSKLVGDGVQIIWDHIKARKGRNT